LSERLVARRPAKTIAAMFVLVTLSAVPSSADTDLDLAVSVLDLALACPIETKTIEETETTTRSFITHHFTHAGDSIFVSVQETSRKHWRDQAANFIQQIDQYRDFTARYSELATVTAGPGSTHVTLHCESSGTCVHRVDVWDE